MKIIKYTTGIVLIILISLIINKEINIRNFKIQQEKDQQERFEQIKEKQRKSEIEILKNKITELENKPIPKPQIIEKTITIDNTKYISTPTVISNEIDLASIVNEWTPRVAFVVCNWTWNGLGSGSATLVNLDYLVMAITNKHVIDSNGYIPNSCVIKNNTGEYTINWTQGISNYSNPYVWGTTEDYGYIRIDNYNQQLQNLTINPIKLCINPQIGDKLLILGYPGIGSKDTITATEGIISGIEQNYYVTSAKIEQGNSGGAAILIKEDCYLGIPSYNMIGKSETLGRILKASFVIK